jgi:hypothetical protein
MITIRESLDPWPIHFGMIWEVENNYNDELCYFYNINEALEYIQEILEKIN